MVSSHDVEPESLGFETRLGPLSLATVAKILTFTNEVNFCFCPLVGNGSQQKQLVETTQNKRQQEKDHWTRPHSSIKVSFGLMSLFGGNF